MEVIADEEEESKEITIKDGEDPTPHLKDVLGKLEERSISLY